MGHLPKKVLGTTFPAKAGDCSFETSWPYMVVYKYTWAKALGFYKVGTSWPNITYLETNTEMDKE